MTIINCDFPLNIEYLPFSRLTESDSGDAIPNDYQKFPYQRVFDVKYDLIQKSSLVEGGNSTVNQSEDIYS
jgi:hypothetical protein